MSGTPATALVPPLDVRAKAVTGSTIAVDTTDSVAATPHALIVGRTTEMTVRPQAGYRQAVPGCANGLRANASGSIGP